MPTRWLLVALAIIACALVGCSDDDDDGPEPQEITGVWHATKVEYVSVPPGSTVELIGLGATATLTLDADADFHYVITLPPDAPETTAGTWSLSGDIMTMTPQGMPFSWQFDVTYAGDTLALDGGSVEFDFDDDDVPDQAKLYLLFDR